VETPDALGAAAAGHRINQPEVLFRQIGDEEIAELKERFKGSQSERELAAAPSGKAAAAKARQSKRAAAEPVGAAGDAAADGAAPAAKSKAAKDSPSGKVTVRNLTDGNQMRPFPRVIG
jgi:Anticodon binding domain of methionyl tRNA ligase